MASRDTLKLMTRAKKGEPAAQLEMGRLYLVGSKGIAPNPSAALNWLLEAWRRGQRCAANDIVGIQDACALSKENEAAYIEACEHAASAGSEDGAFALGEIYLRAGDKVAAEEQFVKAAEAGHAKAALRMGMDLADRDQVPEARRYLELAAKAGEEAAIRPLATLLTRQDSPDSIPWLRQMAEAGDVQAMEELSSILLQAQSPAALEEGRTFLQTAAQRGSPSAMWIWGRLQVRQFRPEALKNITTHSPKRAVVYLERAATLGIVEAHWDLARLYSLPQSSISDLRTARRHLEAAAEAGIGEAQVMLARRLIHRRDDLDAWVSAGQLLESAKADAACVELAEKLLNEISEKAFEWPAEVVRTQNRLLEDIEPRQPAIAARLRLAASFGLTTRETVFIDVLQADKNWCLLVDLRKHFRYRPWRLVRVNSDAQRAALKSARLSILSGSSSSDMLMAGTTRARARRLTSILQQGMQIDPAVFIHDWQTPS